MAETMTPSASANEPNGPKVITGPQIDKAVGLYRALLVKHASELASGSVQLVLGDPGLAGEMLSVFRRRVEEAKVREIVCRRVIVRRVRVDRTLTPMQAIAATGRNKYVDDKIVATMPTGDGGEVDFHFFQPEPEEWTRPGFMSDDDLAKALKKRRLKSDPRAQAKVNEDDPAFADDHPNGTHWKDGDHYNFAAFRGWDDERRVDVVRRSGGWSDGWWFGGVPE